MPPQTNARLTAVSAAAPAAAESFDGPMAPGPEKWAGDAAVYVRERRDRRQSQSAGTVALDRVLIADRDLGIDWRSGDVVTFARTGRNPETGRVKLVELPEIDDPDIDADLQTARLTLETA